MSVATRSRPRRDVVEVGRQAAASGKPIKVSAKFRAAGDWLVAHDLASITDNNKLVLLSSSLQTTTVLKEPRKVDEPEDSKNSVWGLRQKLQRLSWRAGSASKSSVSDKVFNGNNAFKQYLCLLLSRILDVKN